jgi:hypothetical protein
MELSDPNNIAKTQDERAELGLNFQFSTAEMPKLPNCRSKKTKGMCPHATMPKLPNCRSKKTKGMCPHATMPWEM